MKNKEAKLLNFYKLLGGQDLCDSRMLLKWMQEEAPPAGNKAIQSQRISHEEEN